jgi:3-hydroxyisobutyrate dehydrogenase
MKIGFAGLGIMGAPMALNLIKAGHELHVYNRSAQRCTPLTAAGATRHESPGAAADQGEVFISIVSDTPDVEQVLFGNEGASKGLRPGSVAIDMSTISPKATAGFAERLAAQRVSLLDAPVSGGESGAKNATLSIMVGGERAAFDRCLPVLQALGKNVVYAGPSGSGQKTKLVNQVVGSLNLLAAVEGLRLAQAAGLDLRTTLSAVGPGAAGSWMWSNLGAEDRGQGFRAGFRHQTPPEGPPLGPRVV